MIQDQDSEYKKAMLDDEPEFLRSHKKLIWNYVHDPNLL